MGTTICRSKRPGRVRAWNPQTPKAVTANELQRLQCVASRAYGHGPLHRRASQAHTPSPSLVEGLCEVRRTNDDDPWHAPHAETRSLSKRGGSAIVVLKAVHLHQKLVQSHPALSELLAPKGSPEQQTRKRKGNRSFRRETVCKGQQSMD